MDVPVPITERWRHHAACRHTTNPNLFHQGGPHALKVCGTCPAAEPCLWSALALERLTGYSYGIWGGTTPARRRRILTQLPHLDLAAWYLDVAATWQPTQSRRHHPAVAA